ncbi:hypothetical protein ADUPG1_002452 [Aduncisulcus paluster]|uniref:Uncharacterized protein n=2 Tax=Aduncisulcus paluster TaxID=2918883 RepID=A0ABQ5KLD2_9EUKA|nr:hypothetical protein ADUPG1_002452 [Aduncisulcus paluster]
MEKKKEKRKKKKEHLGKRREDLSLKNSSPDEDHHSESLFSKPQLASMVLTRSQVSRLTSANLFFGELQLPTPTSDGAIG